MATTTIFDVVKVSELPVVERLTDGDYLIVNDYNPTTSSTLTKTIVIDDLALATAERTRLREILDVNITSPRGGEILRWSGSSWVNSPEDDSHILLTDLTVYNDLVVKRKGGTLEYDNRLGRFTFYAADIHGPLSNHGNVSENTNFANNQDTLSWNSTLAQWEPAPVVVLSALNLQPVPGDSKGKVEVNGYRIDYTPPSLDAYLLIDDFVEKDPVFVAHPAYTIGGSDIDKWNTAYNWGDHSIEGYLKTLSVAGLNDTVADNPVEGDTLNYSAINRVWVSGRPKIYDANEIGNIEITAVRDQQILRYEQASGEWKNVYNTFDDLHDTNFLNKTEWSIPYWNTAMNKWHEEKVTIIDEVIAGNALTGGGRPLDEGRIIRLDVVPGIASDTSGDKLNVRVGNGAYVNAGNDITINPGAGLSYTVANDGLQVNPGVATDIGNDAVNVRYGDGITIDGQNQIQITSGKGVQILNNNIEVDPGQAISVADGKTNVVVDNASVIVNASNQLEVVFPPETPQDFTNTPNLIGQVNTTGTKVYVSGRDSQDFNVTRLPDVGNVIEYQIQFTTPLVNSNYNVGLETSGSQFMLRQITTKTQTGFNVQLRDVDETVPITAVDLMFTVTY